MSQDTYIEGYVEHIIYRNAENGYSVLQLVLTDGEEEKVVGKFPFISEGEYLSARGEYIDNKTKNLYDYELAKMYLYVYIRESSENVIFQRKNLINA